MPNCCLIRTARQSHAGWHDFQVTGCRGMPGCSKHVDNVGFSAIVHLNKPGRLVYNLSPVVVCYD